MQTALLQAMQAQLNVGGVPSETAAAATDPPSALASLSNTELAALLGYAANANTTHKSLPTNPRGS